MILSKQNDAIKSALHELMLEKTFQSEKVEDILQLFCSTYAFDASVVYDLNLHDFFDCRERYTNSSIPICEQFSIQDMSKHYYKKLANDTLTSLSHHDSISTDERKLLDIFNASSLFVTSIVDSSSCIYSFIFFIQYEPSNTIDEQSMRDLTLYISLLSKHIGLRTYENKLISSKGALEKILDNTGIDIYAIDFYTHDILYVNKSMAAPYGGLDAFTGCKCYDVLFPEQGGVCEFCPQKYLIDDSNNPTKVYSWDYQRAFDGSWFRVFSAAFPWGDGRLAHVVSSVDITENKKNEELIKYMANYDTLTNLPNRRKLVDECESRILNDLNTSGYVLFFDIDKFKHINDNYGHDCGDEFLVQLGEFFSKIPMLKNNIFRNGGDEFVALIDGDINKDQIANLTRSIHQRFKNPWILKKGNIYCNVSIGVACYPQDGLTAEVLINKADQAMYKVKEAGGGSVYFAENLKVK